MQMPSFQPHAVHTTNDGSRFGAMLGQVTPQGCGTLKKIACAAAVGACALTPDPVDCILGLAPECVDCL